MNIRARSGLYQIEIPSSYSYEEDGDILAIYNDANGVGATSVTGYHISKDYNFVISDELQDFVESIDSSAILDDNNITECTTDSCSGEFIDNSGRYWRVWVLFSNCRAVFVSYNCDIADKYVEKSAIDSIVKSVVST